LGNSVAERPVFLLHFDPADKNILHANTQFFMQVFCQLFVESFLAFERPAFIQCDLDNNDSAGALDVEVLRNCLTTR